MTKLSKFWAPVVLSKLCHELFFHIQDVKKAVQCSFSDGLVYTLQNEAKQWNEVTAIIMNYKYDKQLDKVPLTYS